jgi:hypothetical protein
MSEAVTFSKKDSKQMSIIKIISLMSLIMMSLLPLAAKAESDLQTWNSLTLKSKLGKFNYGVEVESRTSETDSNKNLHQIKPEVFYKLKTGKIGFIYTFESDGSFKEKAENRYSFAYDFGLYSNDFLKVATRFRQEFRNFSDESDLAYRLRIRNTLELKDKIFWSLAPSLSSEWRIYEKNSAGKSFENFSHRTILEFEKDFDVCLIAVHYTHNFQKEDAKDQNTHAFG